MPHGTYGFEVRTQDRLGSPWHRDTREGRGAVGEGSSLAMRRPAQMEPTLQRDLMNAGAGMHPSTPPLPKNSPWGSRGGAQRPPQRPSTKPPRMQRHMAGFICAALLKEVESMRGQS